MKPVAAAALLVALLAPATALAWCRATTVKGGSRCFPEKPSDEGDVLFWKRRCVGYAIQQDGSGKVSFKETKSALQAAFDAWQSVECGDGRPSLDIAYMGTVQCDRVEYNDKAGNVNVVTYRDELWPHLDAYENIALTTVTFDKDTGEIFDADLEINTADYAITTGDSNVDYDLVSILTHEAGHFFGLAHSDDADATMRAVYGAGDTDFRTLAPDDAAAICDAYPPRETQPACNPIPRHGFAPECANDQHEGSCALAPAPDPSLPGGGALVGGLVLVLLERRRRRSLRLR